MRTTIKILIMLAFLYLAIPVYAIDTDTMDIKIDSKIISTYKDDVKVRQIDTNRTRILIIYEGRKVIGREMIIKNVSFDDKTMDIEKITKEKITLILDKDKREEIPIIKPKSLIIKLWEVLFGAK